MLLKPTIARDTVLDVGPTVDHEVAEQPALAVKPYLKTWIGHSIGLHAPISHNTQSQHSHITVTASGCTHQLASDKHIATSSSRGVCGVGWS